jgi:hypothetical protein
MPADLPDPQALGMRDGTRYSVHPGFAMEEASLRNLLANTGHDLAWWIARVNERSGESPAARVEWLKREHGLGTNYAQWIVARSENPEPVYDPDGMVEQMFAGKKAGLRPIYDELLRLAFTLGPDVTVTPCATIVPIRRRFVIAQVKPSTQTRLDLGFALKDTPAQGRLLDTGGRAKGDRITHRIPLTAVEEIDEEVTGWLKRAYEMDAG